MSKCIHNDISITINKRVVYINDWFDAGIVFVHNLMDNNGKYLTLDNNGKYLILDNNGKYLTFEKTI